MLAMLIAYCTDFLTMVSFIIHLYNHVIVFPASRRLLSLLSFHCAS